MAENCSDAFTLTHDNIVHITYVYIAFLTPSVIGSFSVLVVSFLRWKNLEQQRQLLVQLALADLLASAVLLSITTSNLLPTKHNQLCAYGLPLALVFYVLSFVLVFSYALKCKRVFEGWRTRPGDREHVQRGRAGDNVLYTLLWSVHLGVFLLYTLWTGHVEVDTCHSCFLFSRVPSYNCSPPDSGMYVLLFFMMVVVLLSSTIIYNKVLKLQQQQQQSLFPVEGDGQSSKRFKHVKHTVRTMMLVIVLCWTPALLLFVFTWKTEQSKLFPLYIIQAATVSSQGFLNCLVYAWKRPNFTEAVLGERTPLITHHYNHVSFFEESLKTQAV